MMKSKDFVAKLTKIANGDFGKTNYGDANHNNGGAKSIGGWNSSLQAWMFDCSGVIKAVLWGWDGNKNAMYGGAAYTSNGVPDINDQGFHDKCNCQTITTVDKIPFAALLWKQGHVGIYIGNGKTIECTTNGKASVQFGTVGTNGARTVSGTSCSAWTKWGKIPYIDYSDSVTDTSTTTTNLKYKVGNKVTINGVYTSSVSANKLTPKIKQGTIVQIIATAKNPYLIDNIGWVNDDCISGYVITYKVGDTVNITGVYTSSTSTNKLTPAIKQGKIQQIIENASNPYLIQDIGWVNDSCITGKVETTTNMTTCKVQVPILEKGMYNNNHVKALQTLLKLRGQNLAVDSSFGNETLSAIKAYQTANGIAVTGRANAETWTKLIGG